MSCWRPSRWPSRCIPVSCLFHQLFAWTCMDHQLAAGELNSSSSAWHVISPNIKQYQAIAVQSSLFLLQAATVLAATFFIGKGNKQSLHIISPTYAVPSSKFIHLENPQCSNDNNLQMHTNAWFSISLLIYLRGYNFAYVSTCRLLQDADDAPFFGITPREWSFSSICSLKAEDTKRTERRPRWSTRRSWSVHRYIFRQDHPLYVILENIQLQSNRCPRINNPPD